MEGPLSLFRFHCIQKLLIAHFLMMWLEVFSSYQVYVHCLKWVSILTLPLQISVCGDFVVAKVATLPTQPVEGGVVSVSLSD